MMVLEIQEHHFLPLGARREMFALEPLRHYEGWSRIQIVAPLIHVPLSVPEL